MADDVTFNGRIATVRSALAACDGDDLRALIPDIAQLIVRHGSLTDAWVDMDVYKAFEEHNVHVVRNHYYGVLLDTRQIPDQWERPAYSAPFRQVSQKPYKELLDAVLEWRLDLKHLPRDATTGFFWNNGMFPPLDAAVYYGLICHLRPKKILEVGSGFSTMLAVAAAEKTGSLISCIEPYPEPHLLGLKHRLVDLDETPLQKVRPEVFERLDDGDVLFIDTSHTCKLGSDVNHLLFDVLPRLKPGVIVHIHDIFLPFEYPKAWSSEIGIMWNEQYAVLAYLMNNPNFEVILPNFLASEEYKDELQQKFGDFDVWNIDMNMGGARGASLWMRRTSQPGAFENDAHGDERAAP